MRSRPTDTANDLQLLEHFQHPESWFVRSKEPQPLIVTRRPTLTSMGQQVHTLLSSETERIEAALLRHPEYYRNLINIVFLATHSGPPLTALAARLIKRFCMLRSVQQLISNDQTQVEALAPLLALAIEERTLPMSQNPLLQHPWSGQMDYACALLGHEQEAQRDAAVAYFAERGAEHQELLVSLLGATDVNVRRSAIQLLARSGYDDRAALLYYRDREEDEFVRFQLTDLAGYGLELAGLEARPGAADALASAADAEICMRPRDIDWLTLSAAPLHWSDGTPVSNVALLGLLKLQRYIDLGLLSRRAIQLIAHLDRSTTAPFATRILGQWAKPRAWMELLWILPLLCALGDGALVPELGKVLRICLRAEQTTAIKIITRSLTLINKPEALMYLAELAYKQRSPTIGRAAISVLEQLAQQQGCTLDALVESIAPGIDTTPAWQTSRTAT